MTGIVNSTGARSGVIGTTVGTPDGGKIVQVKYAERTAPYGNTSPGTGYFPPYTDCDVLITPNSASNKYMINFSFNSLWYDGAGGHVWIKITYNASDLSETIAAETNVQSSSYVASGEQSIGIGNIQKRINVPSANETTFKFEVKCADNVAIYLPNNFGFTYNGLVSLTVSEIAA